LPILVFAYGCGGELKQQREGDGRERGTRAGPRRMAKIKEKRVLPHAFRSRQATSRRRRD